MRLWHLVLFLLSSRLLCLGGEPPVETEAKVEDPPAVVNPETNKNNSSYNYTNAKTEEKTVDETDVKAESDTPSKNVTVSPATSDNVTSESIESIVLPEKGSAEKEHWSSLALAFLLSTLILCIFLIHILLQYKIHYLPESLAIVFLGAGVGMFLKLMPETETKRMEAFSPTMFFLVLLPPIIFESGYNLHKGNFFQNIGSILVFAIFGTAISAFVVGGGVYLLGLADVVYPLNFIQSFAFGSLISAVDPVATLAIFQALDVDPVLNMLVFGESILNDAVAIVLTNTVIESGNLVGVSLSTQIYQGILRFCGVFAGSAAIGIVIALMSSLVLKHVDLYTNPSLEFALMLCFVYSPYALAEGVHLSGIMAILFTGVVMSHYTHYNLSPVTQITMQQTMRTLAFVCETCVFVYLGLGIFSFPHRVEFSLVVWSLVLILLGRALNIFPLSTLCNKFRSHQITNKMMVIMWFSGLRGAIAYALSLHLEFDEDVRKVLVTTTLVVVLFTTIVLGGGTMPLMKYLESRSQGGRRGSRRRRKKDITLSKTRELGSALDSEHLSELTEEEMEQSFTIGPRAKQQGFLYWDYRVLRPFFIRKFTQQELKDGKMHVTELTDKWYQDIQASPLLSTDSDIDLDLQIDQD